MDLFALVYEEFLRHTLSRPIQKFWRFQAIRILTLRLKAD